MDDQRGSTMAIVMVFITVMLLMTGVAVEMSRVLVERERLKTGTEAAALAGALQAKPWIQVTVPESRYSCTTSTGPDGKPVQDCSWEYRDVVLKALETDLVPHWRDMADCSGGWQCPPAPTIKCRGVTYPSETSAVMAQAFQRNVSAADDVHTTLGHMETRDGAATTHVTAAGVLKTQLMRLAKLDQVPFGSWSIGRAEVRELKGWPVGNCW